MNNELYKGLKDELNSLDEEGKKVNSVCALLNEKLKNINNMKIYLVCGKTDLRKGIDGLAALVTEAFSFGRL